MLSLPARTGSLRVLVLGYIVRGPVGGMSWHHLQYVLGLMRLGHDVYFLEDSDDYPACYDPVSHAIQSDPSYGLAYIARVFRRAGCGDRWAYHDAHTSTWHGPARALVDELCRTADLLLNVSGINRLREWTSRVPIRAFIDTDPVFTQIRHLRDPTARELALGHNRFLTFGENFGEASCSMPDDGFGWRPTRQPVVLDMWPVTALPAAPVFTTVMQWESYPSAKHAGIEYGTKAQSFPPYMELPRRVSMPLELSLGGSTAPREELRRHGWRVSDPLQTSREPWDFARYVQQSSGEFTLAKHGYVASHSGWFSERSANYLASGRAVITQDTGFARSWLTGAGLLAFSNPDEAVDALENAARERARHARAARRIAAEVFASERVLGALLETCGSSAAKLHASP